MMTPEEMVRCAVVGVEPWEDLVQHGDVHWTRAGELIVGAVVASSAAEDVVQRDTERAYDALDATDEPLEERDLWNVVLIIALPEPADAQLARRFEYDTKNSRKIVLLPNEPVPQLLTRIATERLDEPSHAVTVEAALDSETRTDVALRRALDVLLLLRRDKEVVNQLISLLGRHSNE